ncbi:MAG: glycosyltransferase, partial [Cyanobacteria bacterium J06576_12]
IEIGIFGAADSAIAQKFPFRTHFLGRLQDTTSLVLAYSAADVFLLPSRQDNLPNTILEALACGTPCIGFNQGGLPDMIQHLQNGFLATPYDTNHLAEGLHWLLSCPARHQALSHQARATAEQKFSQTLQAQQYQTLFESTLRQASTSH